MLTWTEFESGLDRITLGERVHNLNGASERMSQELPRNYRLGETLGHPTSAKKWTTNPAVTEDQTQLIHGTTEANRALGRGRQDTRAQSYVTRIATIERRIVKGELLLRRAVVLTLHVICPSHMRRWHVRTWSLGVEST